MLQFKCDLLYTKNWLESVCLFIFACLHDSNIKYPLIIIMLDSVARGLFNQHRDYDTDK